MPAVENNGVLTQGTDGKIRLAQVVWRVVDISESQRTLTLKNQALCVSGSEGELGRVPISDVQSVILHGYGCMVSTPLLEALSSEGVPVVICGKNHHPASMVLPVAGNFEYAKRLLAQAGSSKPLRKRLWKELVQAKISAQARTLELTAQGGHAELMKFYPKVRSGDPENIEAQAARYYWRRLMGEDFRRDTNGGGLNAPLNYGYTVVRSAVARAVVGAGLSAGLGLHHRARLNAFQLVDDLIEPFRPRVDFLVWQNRDAWQAGGKGSPCRHHQFPDEDRAGAFPHVSGSVPNQQFARKNLYG